jgi:hypothetical protein
MGRRLSVDRTLQMVILIDIGVDVGRLRGLSRPPSSWYWSGRLTSQAEVVGGGLYVTRRVWVVYSPRVLLMEESR